MVGLRGSCHLNLFWQVKRRKQDISRKISWEKP